MEDCSELGAEEEDQTRNVAPRQHSNDCTDGTVNLIVVKVAEAGCKNVLRDFPQRARKKSAGRSAAGLPPPNTRRGQQASRR